MSRKYELPAGFEKTLSQFRAAKIQIASDYRQKILAEGNPSCRKGCSRCCYYPVLTSLMEAILVYRGIFRNHLWTSTLRAKFQEAADRVRGLKLEIWTLSEIPCPLLDVEQGTCKAYSSRPFSCQTVYSRKHPHYCHPARTSGLTQLVPRKEALEEFGKTDSEMMRRHQLGKIQLPLASAVLLAEKLDKGEIDFSTCSRMVWKEYIQKW